MSDQNTLPEELTNLLDIIKYRAIVQPDDIAYIFLEDGEDIERTVTFLQLHEQALIVAQGIREYAVEGDRVILVYQPGMDFIIAFIACVYAGVIAVPVYPPTGIKDIPRFVKISKSSGAVAFCTQSDMLMPMKMAVDGTPSVAGTPCLATDTFKESVVGDWQWPNTTADTIMFLQFTSGSTGDPKGVMVSHGNLLHNERLSQLSGQHDSNLIGVNWAPQYHDMGLIGSILMVPYSGCKLVLLSPIAFLQKPIRWLKAVSKYKATASGGPNFAFELCIRKIKDEDLDTLDLSSWQYAYNGAEAIRTSTLDRFYEKFGKCGFRREAFSPIYGLAEGTLVVTNTGQFQSCEKTYIDKEALYTHKAVELPDDSDGGRWLVGCGQAVLQQVIIVNPDTLKTCDDCGVGEIWVKGGSVCQGYWGKPDVTVETFQAYTSDTNEGPFLRTGDLGFLKNGELYVTGRHKEVVIIDGRNLYPQDIEDLAQPDRPVLRKGCGAAFSVDIDDRECLILVQEIAHGVVVDDVDFDVIATDVRRDILESFGVVLHTLVFIKTGSFLKTSSGKIRRRSMRDKFLKDKLKDVARNTQIVAATSAASLVSEASIGRVKQEHDVAPNDVAKESRVPVNPRKKSAKRRGIESLLLSLLEAHTGISANNIELSRPFSDFGLDSKSLVGLSGELSEALGQSLAPRLLYDYPSIDALAMKLAGEEVLVDIELQAVDSSLDEPIAIIGMGCRLPGGVTTPEQYWQLLMSDSDAIEVVPASRWNVEESYDVDPAVAGKASTKWGGFVSQVAGFDAAFFNISPREAMYMDPQQRLLMESCWEALENAHIRPSSLSGTATGVFVGIGNSDYERLRVHSENPNDPYTGTGNALCISANRISYFLNTHGPSHAIDTACSSSLVAVHQACISLRTGESSLALVGGVNLILTPDVNITFSKARMMAADGRCKTFDEAADGYVRGEGCGIFVLKRLADAEKDGDPILAVVRGSGVSQDGRSNGLTAPHGPSQELAIKNALNQAKLQAKDIQYVEAHGTGTPLGDPIEIGALSHVYGAERSKKNPLYVGSAKTNIGHLEAAAGIAGLMKTVLSLQHKKIPAHRNVKELSSYIPWESINIKIPMALTPWPEELNKTNRAGVSSFGFGGTNAHVIIEEYVARPDQGSVSNNAHSNIDNILALSAKSHEGLVSLIQQHDEVLGGLPEGSQRTGNLQQYCYQNNLSRDSFSHRAAFVASEKQSLIQSMKGFPEKSSDNVFVSTNNNAVEIKTAFMFTGQGSQYVGMGDDFYQRYPVFKDAVDRCSSILQDSINVDIAEILFSDKNNRMDQTEYTQPALFSYEYALAELWVSWGVTPDVVIGHSVGEFVAACIAGVFSLEDALALIAARGRLMAGLSEKGSMMAVFSHKDDMAELLAPYASRVSIGAINGPGQVVLSGGEVELQEISNLLASKNIEIRSLQVSHGFHSPLMEPIVEDFLRVAEGITFNAPTIDVISNVDGCIANTRVACADYWSRHIVAPVLFDDGMRTLAGEGVNVFLEIGPQTTLIGMGRRCLGKENYSWIASSNKEVSENTVLATAIARYYALGGELDWQKINAVEIHAEGLQAEPQSEFKASQYIATKLPTYPFQRRDYWLQLTRQRSEGTFSASYLDDNRLYHPLLGQRLNSPRLGKGEMHFEAFINVDTPQLVKAFVNDGAVSLGIPLYLEMMLESGAEAFHTSAINVMDLDVRSELVVREGDNINIQTFVEPLATNELRVKCYTLSSGCDDGEVEWNLLVSAAVAKANLSRRPKTNRLKTLKEKISHKIDVQEYFENCCDRGLNYCAGTKQVVTQLYGNESEVLGEIHLTGDENTVVAGVRLSHGFIEGCFQILGALCYTDSDTTFIPYRVSRIDIFEEPGPNGWVHVSRQSSWEEDGRHIDVNMTWMNEAGEPGVKISGMKMSARNVPQLGLMERLSTLTRTDRLREIEDFLVRLVCKGLGTDAVALDRNKSLLELGMDSLVAMEVLGRIRYSLEVEINIATLQQGISVNALSQILDENLYGVDANEAGRRTTNDDGLGALVCIHQGAPGRIPLILVHPIGGSIFCYAELARALGDDQPLYALQAHASIDEECALTTVDEMVSEYVREILQIQPRGPYLLGGWSSGGVIAVEIANRLTTADEKVALLVLLDSSPVMARKFASDYEKDRLLIKLMALDLGIEFDSLKNIDIAFEASSLLKLVFNHGKESGVLPELMVISALERRLRIMRIILNATSAHELSQYEGYVSLFKAADPLQEYNALDHDYSWQQYVGEVNHIQTVPGDHFSLLHGSNVRILASYLRKEIAAKVGVDQRYFNDEIISGEIVNDYSDMNTVIDSVSVEKNTHEWGAKLIVNEAHPFFFDHPLDHVPGSLIIEGVLQLTHRVLVKKDPNDLRLIPYVRNINITFRRWLEKNDAVDVGLRLKNGGSNYLCFSGLVTQNDNVACDVDLTVEYQRLPDGGVAGDVTAVSAEGLAEDDLLHKLNEDNVLIRPIDKISNHLFRTTLRQPVKNHVFSDGTSPVAPVMYLLESARQISTHLSHSVYGVPLGTSMNLISMSMTLNKPLERNEHIALSYDSSQVNVNAVDEGVRCIRLDLSNSLGDCGFIEITAQAVKNETYQKQRGLN